MSIMQEKISIFYQALKNCKFIKILSKKPAGHDPDGPKEDFFDDKPIDINHNITLSGYGVAGLLLEKGDMSIDSNGNIIKSNIKPIIKKHVDKPNYICNYAKNTMQPCTTNNR